MLTTIYDYIMFTGPYEDDEELVHNALSLFYDLSIDCDKSDFINLYKAIVEAIVKGVTV